MASRKALQLVNNSSSSKYWTGMLIVHLLIPAILLISGGDYGWWQAWVYAVLIIVAGIGSRIWAEKKHPGLMNERGQMGKAPDVKPWDKVLAPLMAVSMTFPLMVVAGLDHRFGWSPAFPNWVYIIGLLLIMLGYSFASWAIVENRFFSSVVRIQMDREHRVCDSGPYQMVRHPGYAGNVLALPGMVLAFNSLWTIIPVIVALIIAIIRTVLEDKTLKEELPGYRDYSLRVRYKLVPGIF